MIGDLLDDGGVIVVVIGVVLALLIGAWAYALIAEGRQWDAFKIAHACKVVGRERGTTTAMPIVNSNGGVSVGVSSTPDKTGWLCDDGVTYWR